MPRMKLPSQDARYASYDDLEGYELVSSQVVDEWRWGNIYEFVIKDANGRLWKSSYRQQSGDHDYSTFDDENEIEFYEVEAVEVTTVKYKAVKD